MPTKLQYYNPLRYSPRSIANVRMEIRWVYHDLAKSISVNMVLKSPENRCCNFDSLRSLSPRHLNVTIASVELLQSKSIDMMKCWNAMQSAAHCWPQPCFPCSGKCRIHKIPFASHSTTKKKSIYRMRMNCKHDHFCLHNNALIFVMANCMVNVNAVQPFECLNCAVLSNDAGLCLIASHIKALYFLALNFWYILWCVCVCVFSIHKNFREIVSLAFNKLQKSNPHAIRWHAQPNGEKSTLFLTRRVYQFRAPFSKMR